MERRFLIAPILALAFLWAGCSGGSSTSPAPADTIYYDANVETMNAAQPTAEAIAITGSHIVAVGSRSMVFAYKGPHTEATDLHGATILPGFIDPHSHFLAYAFFDDPAHWLDVSSTNMYFKPLPGTSACTSNPPNPQQCFVPIQTEDDMLARIQAALSSATSPETPILAFNYDPARLGHGSTCVTPGGLGFQCPNLEDGSARSTLDALRYNDPSNPNPILVTSESGHI
ncbi:MAG: hypothetical protein ACREP6_14055, partial [Candidatus Binataceae bacterium]